MERACGARDRLTRSQRRGQTTLLRCLLGLSPIDGGAIELSGTPMLEPGGERMHRAGFVPQTFDLFPWMKVRAYLDFTAALYTRWNATRVTRLLSDWELDAKQKIGELSHPIPTCWSSTNRLPA